LACFERACSALYLEEPDRVPLFEMHISTWIAKKLLGRDPIAYNIPLILDLQVKGRPNIDAAVAAELEKLARIIGLDFIRVPYGRNPKTRVEKVGAEKWIINGASCTWRSETLWRDDWTFNRDIDTKSVIESVKLEIERYESGEKDYIFSVLRRLVKKLKGRVFLTFDSDGSWGPIVSNPPLLRCVLKWMYTDPSVPKRLIDAYTDLAVKIGVQAIEEGADAVLMCVDYGYSRGTWMSPEFFRRFVKPALERQCNAFKNAGGFAILHSDGNISGILDDVVEAGIDAYQGIDVEAGMDLSAVKRRYGEELCLIGNVDPRVIDYGSPEDLISEVKRCIEQAAYGGGYVLSASANVSANKNADNFLLMCKAVRKYGRYRCDRS